MPVLALPQVVMQIAWIERQGYKLKKVKAKSIQDVRSAVLVCLVFCLEAEGCFDIFIVALF